MGDVLKADASLLYVDIGVDVLKIPVEEIKSRRPVEQDEKIEEAQGPLENRKSLYRLQLFPIKV
ncbi:MAG: hypothetical protein R3C11_06150 [Planctomycetaceae bacterium]